MASTFTPTPRSTTLYFGPWYRQSPYFHATLRAGCRAFDIYNHTCLPAAYDDPIIEYEALDRGVTMWDVACERTVEISGSDADLLVDRLTCRDLTACAVGQCKYMIITAPDGGIVNDPVLLHVGENRWWMQLADSDAGLYALGVATGLGLDVEIAYPEVHPMQVQGPKSGRTLEKLIGPGIYDLRYYWCRFFDIKGIPVLVSRTGWSAVPGFEVNLLDATAGDRLWDLVASAGEAYGIRPIAPSQARRIEAGIFNYGSDMGPGDTPLHVSGLERLVEDGPRDYIGREALEKIRRDGVDRKLVGIEIEGQPLDSGPTRSWTVLHDGEAVGRVTDAIWSPGLRRNIGYAWVPIALAAPGTAVRVDTEDGDRLDVRTASLPFVDPHKKRPAAPLGRVAH